MANPDPSTLVYFDQTNRVPAPYGQQAPFNQEQKDIWLGYHTETGQVCITNYNRTSVITCFAGGDTGESYVKVDLTAAQIKTLRTVPVAVPIPAPGVGKLIRLTWGVVKYKFGTVPFTNGQVRVKFSTTNSNPGFTSICTTGFILNQTQDVTQQEVLLAGGSFGNLAEDDTLLLTTLADSLVGDGTAEVWLYYKIITL